MGPQIIPIIIILFFVFGGAIKRMLEQLQQQAGGGGEDEGGYEATADEIRRFLERSRSPRAMEGEQPVPPAEVRPPRAAAGPQPARPGMGDAGSLIEQLFMGPSAEEARLTERLEERRREAAMQERARREEEAKREKARRAEARREAARREERARQAAAAETVAKGGDFDLKRAVIWAEILGRPVSLRDRRGGPPVRKSALE